jgi:hypothetical protein
VARSKRRIKNRKAVGSGSTKQKYTIIDSLTREDKSGFFACVSAAELWTLTALGMEHSPSALSNGLCPVNPNENPSVQQPDARNLLARSDHAFHELAAHHMQILSQTSRF